MLPTHFDLKGVLRSKRTKDAVQIAGLDVLRITYEQTTALLCYGLDEKDNKNIWDFDLGGGIFNVSILEVDDGVFEVLVASGDTHLGGYDFGKAVVNWFVSEFKNGEGIDLNKDRQALMRLKEAAKKVKWNYQVCLRKISY